MTRVSELYVKYLMKEALTRAVSDAINAIGLDQLKKTSMFLSNQKEKK